MDEMDFMDIVDEHGRLGVELLPIRAYTCLIAKK